MELKSANIYLCSIDTTFASSLAGVDIFCPSAGFSAISIGQQGPTKHQYDLFFGKWNSENILYALQLYFNYLAICLENYLKGKDGDKC